MRLSVFAEQVGQPDVDVGRAVACGRLLQDVRGGALADAVGGVHTGMDGVREDDPRSWFARLGGVCNLAGQIDIAVLDLSGGAAVDARDMNDRIYTAGLGGQVPPTDPVDHADLVGGQRTQSGTQVPAEESSGPGYQHPHRIAPSINSRTSGNVRISALVCATSMRSVFSEV